MGDDIYYKFFDDDRGKDEKIGEGMCKISTFCAEENTDTWLSTEYKGKGAGKAHFTARWEPRAEPPKKEEHEDMMGKAQEAIMKLAARKNELETEYEAVHVDTAAHDEEIAKMREDFEEADCQGAFDEAVAAANFAFEAEMERIERERNIAAEGKEDFEKRVAAKIEAATGKRDDRLESCEEAHAKADTDKEEAVAALEAAKIAFTEENDAKKAALEEEIAGIVAADQADYDSVAEEIKAIAEHLLELNEKMQEKLTALTQL
jgi:hypothetical protein